MDASSLQLIQSNEIVRKRLAKLMALECFRNAGVLEDLHAGTHPSSKAGDFTDVKVVSPYGEIPWGTLSRFDDAEMKQLMTEVVNRSYVFLSNLFSDPHVKVVENLQISSLS